MARFIRKSLFLVWFSKFDDAVVNPDCLLIPRIVCRAQKKVPHEIGQSALTLHSIEMTQTTIVSISAIT